MKKAIELSVLCECDILLIGFGSQQVFTYSTKDLDSLLQEYKTYAGVCEMFDNGDLDSLKPGKITTGCTVVQRKQGVNIPISKREIRPTTPDNGHHDFYPSMHQVPMNMPMNHQMMMPMAAFNMMPGPPAAAHPQPSRKRKSLPGMWMGMSDFSGLNFQGGLPAPGPLRTPPGLGPVPSYTLAAPVENKKAKNKDDGQGLGFLGLGVDPELGDYGLSKVPVDGSWSAGPSFSLGGVP